MAISVTIDKKPLFGTVYWNGADFIYTPNAGFIGKDYYIYTMTDGASSVTKTNYVSTLNKPPTAGDINLTIDARYPISIDVSSYIFDFDAAPEAIRISKIGTSNYGLASFSGKIIKYAPYGFDGYDELTYTVTDGQNDATAKVIIYLINGKTYEAPPEILEVINNTQELANNFAELSVIWNASTSLVESNSSKWMEIDQPKYENASNIVSSNSAYWNYSSDNLPTFDTAYNIVTANSGEWINSITILNNLTSNYETNSFNWNNSFDVVTSLSGNWNKNVIDIGNLTNSYSSNSSFWNDVFNIVTTQSTFWDKSFLTNFLTQNSGYWTNTYNIIDQNSASWISASNASVGAYANFNNVSSIWDTTYTVVKVNSGSWNQNELVNLFANNSGGWITTSNLVTANSSTWDNAVNTNSNLNTLLSTNSANWQNAYNLVSSKSATWGGVAVFDFLAPLTGNWNTAYTTLTASSANWNNVNLINQTFSTVSANSANWNSSYNILTSNSANWNNAYTNVVTNSSRWLSGDSTVDAYFNNVTAFGDVVIYGNISAAGSITQQSSDAVTASSFSVINTGFVDAFSVKKTQTTGALADFNVNDNSVLYVTTDNRVGINTKTPNQALTIVGDVSASGTVFSNLPSSYTLFLNNSSKYDTANTYFTSNSGSIVTLLNAKPSYDAAVTYLTAASGNINSFYPVYQNLYNNLFSAVTSQSAQNYSSYSTVCSTSALIGTDTLFRSKSANYENAFNFVTANSAGWILTNPVFNSLRTNVLTSGSVTLTNAVLSTFTTPITASEEFLSITVNNQTRLIQLWNA